MILEYMTKASPRGALANADAELFELLYPALPPPATTSEVTHFSTRPADALGKIAEFQVRSIDAILKKRFALPAGLADGRALVLNVTPGIIDYSSLLPPDATPPSAPRIPVILGILPPMDAVDVELLKHERLLDRYSACPDDDGPNMAAQTAFPPRGPKPLAEYWGAYADYLRNRPQTAHPEPAFPGQYRELLELRQQVRDRRLQYLHEYTGILRVKAREEDALAGCQAIFFRFAEMVLLEGKRGVASLAAHPMALDRVDMTHMRKHIMKACTYIAVDEVDGIDFTHGSLPGKAESIETEIPAPGKRGGSGTAVFTMAKTGRSDQRDDKVWRRRHPDANAALASLRSNPGAIDTQGQTELTPNERSNYSFLPPRISRDYLAWPSLPDISAEPPLNGLMEKRRGALIDIDGRRLEKRMRAYFDASVSWDELVAMGMGLTVPQSRFEPKEVREAALGSAGFDPRGIRGYAFKPFDERRCYHSTIKSLWSDPKPRFADLCGPDNQFVVSRANKVMDREGIPFYCTPFLGDNDLLRGHAYYFPVWRVNDEGKRVANLSKSMMDYLAALGVLPGVPELSAARMMWNHALAVGLSPAYLSENAEAIGQDWPRIPFPRSRAGGDAAREEAKSAFVKSSRLGADAAALLNPAAEIDGVTKGDPRPELRDMAVLWDAKNGGPPPADEAMEIPVTMGWGRQAGENMILPSHGRLWSRHFTADERRALEDGARAIGLHAGGTYACMGTETYDIHLNEKMVVRNIPANVWTLTVGGYQVLKKWLSYRETAILGRPLRFEEVETFQKIVRRIAALLLMTPRLNRNYAVVRDLHRPLEDNER